MDEGDLKGNTKKESSLMPEFIANDGAAKENSKSIPYYKLFQFSTCTDKVLMGLGVLFSILCGITMPLFVTYFGDAVGYVVDYTTKISSGNLTDIEFQEAGDELTQQIKRFAINMSAVGFGTILLTYLGNVLFSYSASRQAYTIRKLYLSKMLNQDIGWYDQHQTTDFAFTISENLAKIEEGMGEKIAIFLYYETIFVSGIIFALILGWELTLICFVSLPVSAATMTAVTWLSGKFTQRELDAYAAASAIAEEVLSAIRTVVAFDGKKVESARYGEHLIYAKQSNIRKALFTSINNGIMWFFVYACYSLSFWYGIGLYLKERNLPEYERVYTSGNIVAVFSCSIMSSWFFGMAAPYIQIFSTAASAAVKVFSVIDSKPKINLSKGHGKTLEFIKGEIQLKDVYFEYPSRSGVKVLDHLNLTIKAGEKVALVGSSGCGKSTTIQLIQRFYDPISGEVCLDGHNIKDFDLTWLRHHIGVVNQEPTLFATTIAENIRYGKSTATQNEIEQAAKKANAHQFITELPQGYNTVIGERGTQLSGGQKQRIAIARALVREPAILLFDEATSALDTTSEAVVQAALDSAAKECTTITVAHRLSTVRNADRILVFSEGKIVEEGNHQELMTLQGLYYNLVTSQDAPSENIPGLETSAKEHNEEFKNVNFNTFKNTKAAEENRPKDISTSNSMKSIYEVMKLNKPEWLEITIGCVAAIFTGAALPLYSLVFGDVIGIFAEENDDVLRSEANRLCLFFLIIGIMSGVANFLQTYMFARSGEKLTKRVRHLMFESMMHQEIGWFDLKDNNVGALCTRLSNQASSIQGASGQCIGTLLNSASTFFIASCLALSIHWKISLVALSFSPFIFISIYYEQKIVGDDTQVKKSLENSAKVAVEAIASIRTVASLGNEDTFCGLYNLEILLHHKNITKQSHFRSVMLGLARSLMLFSYAAAISYGVSLVINDGLDYGIVFKIAECVIVGSWSIGIAVAFSPNFQKGVVAANDTFALLHRVPKIRNYPNAITTQWSNRNVTYNDVHFSYPTRPSVPVLRGLNLSVLDGKTVALVGSSGCGKSTLIQLLERFYDPTSGEVEVDGTLLRYMDLEAARSQLGIVSQEPNLFNRSIMENIAYGANNRKVAMDEIISAAKKANIHDFIASLPLGYDTKVGERATQLSGGQKQRIAIARALVRDPKILLLDEATSALDNESEKIVQESLDNAKVGRTCITIAHRLTTVQGADVICVISDGHVVEIGTHSELIARRGLYYRFYRQQALI